MQKTAIKRFRVGTPVGPSLFGPLNEWRDFTVPVELDPGEPLKTERVTIGVRFNELTLNDLTVDPIHREPNRARAAALVRYVVLNRLAAILAIKGTTDGELFQVTDEEADALALIDARRVRPGPKEWTEVTRKHEMMSERTVFICHAEVDKAVANAIGDFLRKADKRVQVFIASHPESLPPGREWWEEIRDHLINAQIVLTIVSPRSKERPWLHFESGGAYFRGVTVIPLALPPEPKTFPLPLGVLQGLDLGVVEEVKALVRKVESTFGVRFQGTGEGLCKQISGALESIPNIERRRSAQLEEGPPWQSDLLSLASVGDTIKIYPVVPTLFSKDRYEILTVDRSSVKVRKHDSGYVIFIPSHRVAGLSQDSEAHVLEVKGRLQWVDADNSWHFMPESPEPDDPEGFWREVDPSSSEIHDLAGQLRTRGWSAEFARESKARANLSEGYQLVYGRDGRYLRASDRLASSVFVKQRIR